VAYVFIALGFAFAGGIVGKLKGSSFFLWFLISGILPFVGLAAALVYRWDRDEPRRQCPRCGNIVMLHDAVCTRCGAELEFPDVVLAPESASPRPGAS
jgi:ribosomal protein S27AE